MYIIAPNTTTIRIKYGYIAIIIISNTTKDDIDHDFNNTSPIYLRTDISLAFVSLLLLFKSFIQIWTCKKIIH